MELALEFVPSPGSLAAAISFYLKRTDYILGSPCVGCYARECGRGGERWYAPNLPGNTGSFKASQVVSQGVCSLTRQRSFSPCHRFADRPHHCPNRLNALCRDCTSA